MVVSTKTELDYAMKHGQISVWAPSKIVLDASKPPDVDANNTYKLAYWLMVELNGAKLSVIGMVPEAHNDDNMVTILPLEEDIF